MPQQKSLKQEPLPDSLCILAMPRFLSTYWRIRVNGDSNVFASSMVYKVSFPLLYTEVESYSFARGAKIADTHTITSH